jgi:hypothetical protein
MKQSLRYEQISCRLQIEGVPDVSIGQSGAAIGILTGWTLQWAGRPELEGKKEHLLALMQAVLPYARRLISGAPCSIGGGELPVAIAPSGPNVHRLELRSSQPDTPPLTVQLDDAELADLVRVLDQLRLDPRLTLDLQLPADVPLRARELNSRIPKRQRFAAPAAAVILLALCGSASLLWPVPKPSEPAANQGAASGKTTAPR